MLILTLCLTGCAGSFFEDDASNAISHIDDELMSDGRTKITIYFANEEIEPKVFYLPQGVAGDGIKKIEHSVDASSHSTIITISFTSENIDPVTLSIPHGVYIYSVISAYDDEKKAPYLLVQYSDGSTSERFYLPQGEKGNGIKSFDYTINNDKSVTLEFVLDDGTTKTIPIPAPQNGKDGIDGEDGLGIVGLSDHEEGSSLVLDIEYTDGNTDHVPMERPYKWYTGGTDPNNILNDDGTPVGNEGDYFFDTIHAAIYIRDAAKWNNVISFKNLDDPYTVTFDLNADHDGGPEARMPDGWNSTSININPGTYFSDPVNGKNDIPIPERDGYNFVGWCTKAKYDSRTMSFFTDLTPVSCSLTLYAIWEAK